MSWSPFFFYLSFIAAVSSELLPAERGCDPDALEIAYCHHYRGPLALHTLTLSPSLSHTHTQTATCKCARGMHETLTHIYTRMQHSLGVHSPTGPELSVAPVGSLFSSRPAGKPPKRNALNKKKRKKRRI